jgi:hypothetical protein
LQDERLAVSGEHPLPPTLLSRECAVSHGEAVRQPTHTPRIRHSSLVRRPMWVFGSGGGCRIRAGVTGGGGGSLVPSSWLIPNTSMTDQSVMSEMVRTRSIVPNRHRTYILSHQPQLSIMPACAYSQRRSGERQQVRSVSRAFRFCCQIVTC